MKDKFPKTSEKHYDLEERTLLYAKEIVPFLKMVKRNIFTIDTIRQIIRSSSAIGANYLEANDSLGKKDFLMRLRICRKEAKETVYWLNLLVINDLILKRKRDSLVDEASQFVKIFSSIIQKSK
jgi:four helix bundle protein